MNINGLRAPVVMVCSETGCFNPLSKERPTGATYMTTHLSELLNLQSSMLMYLQGILISCKQFINLTLLWIPELNEKKKMFLFHTRLDC